MDFLKNKQVKWGCNMHWVKCFLHYLDTQFILFPHIICHTVCAVYSCSLILSSQRIREEKKEERRRRELERKRLRDEERRKWREEDRRKRKDVEKLKKGEKPSDKDKDQPKDELPKFKVHNLNTIDYLNSLPSFITKHLIHRSWQDFLMFVKSYMLLTKAAFIWSKIQNSNIVNILIV